MQVIKPNKIESGGTIGIFAPSDEQSDAIISSVLRKFYRQDFGFVFDRSIKSKTSDLWDRRISPRDILGKRKIEEPKTSPEEKAAGFHRLLQNPEVDIIWIAQGGEGCIEMIPHIDWDIVQENPKIIIGFSDITALLNAVTAQTGLVTFHAENIVGAEPGRENYNMLMRMLRGQKTSLTNDFIEDNYATKIDYRNPQKGYTSDFMRVVSEGKVSGRMIGGNLTLLRQLHELGIQHDFQDAVLFLEDAYEPATGIADHIDYFSAHGVFNEAAGLIIGGFDPIDKPYEDLKGRPVPKILFDLASEFAAMSKPCIIDAPIGHERTDIERRLFPVPIGSQVTLNADPFDPSITLSEPAVQR